MDNLKAHSEAKISRSPPAGCSIGPKSRLLHVSGWDMSQTKNWKYSLDTFFSKMVYVNLGSWHANVLCVQVFVCLTTLGLTSFWGYKNWHWLWCLLYRLWLQMTSESQDGSSRIRDILSSLLYSGRKRRQVVHLYTSMAETHKCLILLTFVRPIMGKSCLQLHLDVVWPNIPLALAHTGTLVSAHCPQSTLLNLIPCVTAGSINSTSSVVREKVRVW